MWNEVMKTQTRQEVQGQDVVGVRYRRPILDDVEALVCVEPFTPTPSTQPVGYSEFGFKPFLGGN